jgi:TPR repeat protein
MKSKPNPIRGRATKFRLVDEDGHPLVDSDAPWMLTLRDYDPFIYTQKMSASKWRDLLDRAKHGDAEAEWEVGSWCADGCLDNKGKILVRRSARTAAKWLRRAAEHGNGAAQNTLGVNLSNGTGVTKNVSEAISWLTKAFHSGSSCAAHNLAITYREIGKLKMAVTWFRKAADAGDNDARIQLGIHYYWGRGVQKNPKAAMRCFREALKGNFLSGHGRDDAHFFLGLAHLEGAGVKRSIPIAVKLFEQANVDGDHPAAHKMLRLLQKNKS